MHWTNSLCLLLPGPLGAPGPPFIIVGFSFAVQIWTEVPLLFLKSKIVRKREIHLRELGERGVWKGGVESVGGIASG